ncbi:MAG TPA: hypothetical protein VGH55_06885 [Chthoniobacterales bacterium]|jgi:hypothetical protein
MAQRTHPHAEATYRVVPYADGAFSVEVDVPESYPTRVSPFATKADCACNPSLPIQSASLSQVGPAVRI